MDWSIKVGYTTYFSLLRKNRTLSSWLRFLANKIGGYGFYFVNSKGVTVQWDPETIARINYFFWIPQLRSYIYTTLINYMVSGQKVSTATKINKAWKATNDAKINILDPRMLSLVLDLATGEVTRYDYRNKSLSLELPPKLVHDDILYPDMDRDWYWQSMMESIVIDAVTDLLTWSRQFHLYRNNATPWTVYLLDKDNLDDKSVADLEMKINDKFGGNANAWKPLASTAIKGVETIEIPKLDTINEREMIMKIVTTVLWLDPRVLWFMKESWAYAEIDAIARGITNAKLKEWTEIIETSMQQEYEKFIWPLPYKIKLDTIYFENKELDKKMALEEVKLWILTPDEYKSLFDV